MIQKKRLISAICLFLVCLCCVTPAFAQLDYDTYDVFQNGNIVGVIYVPVRGTDTSIYTEYWILSSRYVYPSEKNLVTTEIKNSAGYHYTSVTDFFTKAPFAEGDRFVTVIADDRATFPRPTATLPITNGAALTK